MNDLIQNFVRFVSTNSIPLRLILTAVLVLCAAFGEKLLSRLTRRLHRQLEQYAPEWLRILNDGFEQPLLLLLRVTLLFFAVLALPLPWTAYQVMRAAGRFYSACVVALLAWGLWRSAGLCHLLLRSAQNKLDLNSNKTMIRFFEKIYRAVIVLFAVLAILEIFGVPVGGIVTGAGIAGLAVSLAAQSTLSNLIAGVTLVLERPFGIGDYVVLDSFEGTVEEISFRSTRLRTPDNVVITVENSQVCSAYIQNVTDRTSRLWNFTIGLTYGTPRETVERLCGDLTRLLQNNENVRKDTVQIILAEFGSSSIDLDVRMYFTTLTLDSFRELKNRLNLEIMDLMARDGCEFAYPSTSVYLESVPGRDTAR